MLNVLRVLMGYAVAGLGGYLVVIDAKPFSVAPFFAGIALVVGGMIFTDPARGIPMLGYCVSAITKFLPWVKKPEQEPHAHKRRSDPGAHHHQRQTPPAKRMSVSDFTISEPIVPVDDPRPDHPHRHRKGDHRGD